jgi:hypothetical protein
MKKIYQYLFNSFTNEPEGFSARKLSAFVGVATAIYLTMHYCTMENVVELAMVWLLFALLCMGIITFEQIIKFRHGAQQPGGDSQK